MGWGRYLLLGDLDQQLDLVDQKGELERPMENTIARWGEL